MREDTHPKVVMRFIEEKIHSVEQLEILLLIASKADTIWTPELTSKELRSSPRSSEKWLETLVEQGLLHKEGSGYSFKNVGPDTRELVRLLGEAYGTYRVSIIEAIFAKPSIRLQTLADAFKFRKE